MVHKEDGKEGEKAVAKESLLPPLTLSFFQVKSFKEGINCGQHWSGLNQRQGPLLLLLQLFQTPVSH